VTKLHVRAGEGGRAQFGGGPSITRRERKNGSLCFTTQKQVRKRITPQVGGTSTGVAARTCNARKNKVMGKKKRKKKKKETKKGKKRKVKRKKNKKKKKDQIKKGTEKIKLRRRRRHRRKKKKTGGSRVRSKYFNDSRALNHQTRRA